MKKEYQRLLWQFVCFTASDVITASTDADNYLVDGFNEFRVNG
jgi:hypothetical protein